MSFTISNGTASYTLPLDPQVWRRDVKPKYSRQDTLGGQVVQLLGYAASGSFEGLLHNHMVSRQDAWNDMALFQKFMVKVFNGQQAGAQSHIEWKEEGYSFDCVLGDFEISEDMTQTGLRYSMSFTEVSQSVMKNSNDRSAVMSMLLAEIGYNKDDEYHGGDGSWDNLVQITGFANSGPEVSDSNSTSSDLGDVKMSSNASKREMQEYARKKVLAMGWTEEDFKALIVLWDHESGWDPTIKNPYSEAFGIPQAMVNMHGLVGTAYMTSWKAQIDWGLNYIKNNSNFHNPREAWAFWQRRVPINGRDVGNWY